MRRFISATSLTVLALSLGGTLRTARAAGETQNIQFSDKVEIPGATLKPGSYSFSVEDRLTDRAIVRISSTASDAHYLILSVPASNITAYGSNNVALFSNQSGKGGAVKAWKCPGCAAGLEFVYPKAGAAKLTSKTADSVLAFDPTYDKLPAKLSPDDMKVVTLWLLSPKRIKGNHGKGLAAAKYAGQNNSGTELASSQPASGSQATPAPTPEPSTATSPANRGTELSQSPEPTSTGAAPAVLSDANAARVAPSRTTVATSEPTQTAPTETASAGAPSTGTPSMQAASNSPRHLPKTASNTYTYGLAGLLAMSLGLALRIRRTSRVSR